MCGFSLKCNINVSSESYFRSGSLELRYVVERSVVEDVFSSHNPRRRNGHLTLFDILSDKVGVKGEKEKG